MSQKTQNKKYAVEVFPKAGRKRVEQIDFRFDIPSQPGIYGYFAPDGHQVYVGVANDLRRRLRDECNAGLAGKHGWELCVDKNGNHVSFKELSVGCVTFGDKVFDRVVLNTIEEAMIRLFDPTANIKYASKKDAA